jgi:glyoxylase-like metal-dependent hydrolase (beta-lactamase superfamily II)
MEFRQLFDKESSTYTYLLADPASKLALLIDPVIEQVERDAQLVKDLGLKLAYALDTHVHADHVTALDELKSRTGCQTVLSSKSGVSGADLLVKEGDRIRCGAIEVEVIETPGHTVGCVSYRVGRRVFTGDALLIRGCGRTDFQGGSAETLYDSVVGKLFRLPDETEVYPAHDYKGSTRSTIGEEKRLNPRLTLAKPAFVELMRGLNLPDPKLLHIAVPANLRCGKR